MSRPSWQRSDCPPWCVVEHREGDSDGDRVHRSDGRALPVLARRSRMLDGGLRRVEEEDEFEVGLSRVDGEAITWLYVGSGPGQQIEFDAAVANRLVVLIGSVITMPFDLPEPFDVEPFDSDSER